MAFTRLRTFSSGGASSTTPGTTPVVGGSNGSILFVSSGVVAQNNSNLFWDNSDARIKVTKAAIGWSSGTPSAVMDIRSNGNGVGNFIFRVRYSDDSLNLFSVRGNGLVYFANDLSYFDPNTPAFVQTGNAIYAGTSSVALSSTGGAVRFFASNQETARVSADGLLVRPGGSTWALNPSAALEVDSTSGGLLLCRMSGSQAEAIGSPADALLVYINNGNGTTITSEGFWCREAGVWKKFTTV